MVIIETSEFQIQTDMFNIENKITIRLNDVIELPSTFILNFENKYYLIENFIENVRYYSNCNYTVYAKFQKITDISRKIKIESLCNII